MFVAFISNAVTLGESLNLLQICLFLIFIYKDPSSF